MNASSCRNKSTIHEEVRGQINSLSITAFLGGNKEGVTSGRRHVLIMDEVDGMDGNADRSGVSVRRVACIKDDHYYEFNLLGADFSDKDQQYSCDLYL